MRLVLPVRQTPSRAQTASNCYRKHALKEIACRSKKKNVAASFGTLIHWFAGEWWQGWLNGTAGTDLLLHLLEQLPGQFEETVGTVVDYHTPELAESMMRYYVDHADPVGELGPGWRLVEVERRLTVPVWKGATMSFQRDRLCQHEDLGLLAIIDTKTTRRISQRYQDSHRMSLQQRLYKWGTIASLEEPIAPFAVENIIEGCPKEQSRIEYMPLPSWDAGDLEEARDQFIRICDQDDKTMRDVTGVGAASPETILVRILHQVPFNFEACNDFGGCEYKALCSTPSSSRLQVLLNDYEEFEPINY